MQHYGGGSGSSQGHVMGPCPCGLYHSQTNSFNMLLSMPNHQSYDHYDESDMYNSFTPSSSSVDCTLSLGTPSTRFTQEDEQEKRNRHQRRRNSVSNFCLQSKHNPQSHGNQGPANDPLLARRCANCDTTSTPLWRNGPRGPKSLCNACGIRFKKEERRASAAAATTSGGVMDSQQMYNNSWYPHSQSQRMPCYSPGMGNEYHFIDDGDQEPDNGIPYLSWRRNVTDRPSLVHDYTR